MNSDQTTNTTSSSDDDIPVEASVNDVLAQQMGTDYPQVEDLDKQQLQKDLRDQADEQAAEEPEAFGADTSEDASYGKSGGKTIID